MKYIKTRDALQAFYYLIAVDGSVRDDERALFDHIGDNLDAKHLITPEILRKLVEGLR